VVDIIGATSHDYVAKLLVQRSAVGTAGIFSGVRLRLLKTWSELDKPFPHLYPVRVFNGSAATIRINGSVEVNRDGARTAYSGDEISISAASEDGATYKALIKVVNREVVA
jgi:hypothetical protein